MPMLDAYIPEGALDPERERNLIRTLTATLLRWEGADPNDERIQKQVRSIVWTFVHRPKVYVGGDEMVSQEPRYKIVVSLPEGQLDGASRAGLIEEITNQILDAEPAGRSRNPFRIWIFCNTIPEGTWGSGGKVFGLAEISSFVFGDRELGKTHAATRLAAARSKAGGAFTVVDGS
ncbi:phenylpyruvate tautomerase PptA (4-oxalocrotonate tautomerase family) [Bradyrhizobium sp. USDA 4461]